LASQLGFDASFSQKSDTGEAERLLDKAGWLKQPDGFRSKDGVKLELGLTTVNSSQYTALAGELQKQWSKIGVRINPQLLTPEQLQQTALSAHGYDILLYGISIGHDPDVYAYWHSSQARTGGLNFSEWKSSRADSSLEVARTRLDDVLRIARYKTFQDEWLKGAPAVALYQPRVNYAYHQNASGFVPTPANNASDRLTNVEQWTVNTKQVDQTP
jgi:peptide/nickel transport system substrate-binding protein